ncbi:hypothetical protein [Candidatus Magnetaquicoccus inordinatus]|uniref:hypothetical protein n=1 Tax=Candidatus Magnetaquicoccus inordinatus TaxID=2496818 RepID=UPI00102BB1AB|nr:hypothetical protein [Candidatus Magnetaquicoccus inordinatus]
MAIVKYCSDYDLRDSWKNFRKYSPDQYKDRAFYLLYFYAIECGLKYILIKNQNLQHCPEKGDDFFSHNLAKILRKIDPNASEIKDFPKNLSLQLPLSGSINHNQFYDIHLAWRYGWKVIPQNEKAIIEWLKKLDELIDQRMRKL